MVSEPTVGVPLWVRHQNAISVIFGIYGGLENGSPADAKAQPVIDKNNGPTSSTALCVPECYATPADGASNVCISGVDSLHPLNASSFCANRQPGKQNFSCFN